MKYVACVSGGKDSVFMLYVILFGFNKYGVIRQYPLDHVVFVNTGMEFDAVITVVRQVKKLLDEMGIPFTEIDLTDTFRHSMFHKEVCKQGTKEVHRIGYGWCGGVCRWGTALKRQALERFFRETFPGEEVCQYVGIAADEEERLDRGVVSQGYKRYPLVEAGFTEAMALEGCYKQGYTWEEDGVRLYDVLDRLSCFCCRNKNLKELKQMYYKLPKYWNKLRRIEQVLGEPMKGEGMSLSDLEDRFFKEGYQLSVFDLVD